MAFSEEGGQEEGEKEEGEGKIWSRVRGGGAERGHRAGQRGQRERGCRQREERRQSSDGQGVLEGRCQKGPVPAAPLRWAPGSCLQTLGKDKTLQNGEKREWCGRRPVGWVRGCWGALPGL